MTYTVSSGALNSTPTPTIAIKGYYQEGDVAAAADVPIL